MIILLISAEYLFVLARQAAQALLLVAHHPALQAALPPVHPVEAAQALLPVAHHPALQAALPPVHLVEAVQVLLPVEAVQALLQAVVVDRVYLVETDLIQSQ